jgi:exosortase A-associated hydrolase 2
LSRGELSAEFIAGSRGRLLAVVRRPSGAACNGVLIVPPFAEEMNKSRHLFTEIADALIESGVATVVVDLFGTGDSEGEFSDADWTVWKSDLAAAVQWAASRQITITKLLAVRLGCALGCEAARDNGWKLDRTIMWQPVVSGTRALDQFLRLRVAATMMQKEGKETIAGLRAKLKSGQSVEVAGYDMSGRLAEQLDRVDLGQTLGANLGAVRWVEVVRSADAPPPAAATASVERARASGASVELHTVLGEPFWSSVEIVRNPTLVADAVNALGAAA